jgi:AcrR family transcriptional regulator
VSTVEPIPSLRVIPRQARGRDKLARVLEAADHILATDGVEAVTTTRVAIESSVSVGSVYRYLPNRDAILEALAKHYLDALEERMDTFVAESMGRPPLEIVDTGVDVFADFYRSHAGFRALWFSRDLSPETRALDRMHNHAMAEKIRDLLVHAGLGKEDRDTLRVALVIQLSTDSLMHEAFRSDPRGDRALLAQAKRLIRSYVRSYM